MTKYSFFKGLTKSITQFIVFGLPIAVTSLEYMPQTSAYLDLSVGAFLALVVNYAKVKYNQAYL